MIYIEYVFVCLAAPLIIALFCLGGKRKRQLLFLLGGMSACFLSSYITTYLSFLVSAEGEFAVVEVAPFVEEVMKIAPILFYILAFSPKKEKLPESIIMVAVGFATFENVCYLLNNGAGNIVNLLIRGFGTGTMHVVCGMIVSLGILWLWENRWLRFIGTLGLLSVAITFHGVYNILVSQESPIAIAIGCLIPVVTMVVILIISKKNSFFKSRG